MKKISKKEFNEYIEMLKEKDRFNENCPFANHDFLMSSQNKKCLDYQTCMNCEYFWDTKNYKKWKPEQILYTMKSWNKEIPILAFVKVIKYKKDDDFPQSHDMGWYMSIEEAIQCVKENWLDIHECCYNYALVQLKTRGPYSRSRDYQWFIWKGNDEDGGYIECERPKAKAFQNIAF